MLLILFFTRKQQSNVFLFEFRNLYLRMIPWISLFVHVRVCSKGLNMNGLTECTLVKLTCFRSKLFLMKNISTER